MKDLNDAEVAGGPMPPTPQQITSYALRQDLRIPDDEVGDEIARVSAALGIIQQLDRLAEPRIPPRHPHRDPGRAPRPDEDPCNAIIRFCEVRGAEEGPLAGMRLGIKDNIAVAGVPMTNGRRAVPPRTPAEDAVVVERLLDAGATVVAKTAIHMGGHGGFGLTLNPVDPRFFAGASSSGSGAAVAAGIVDAAVGADQGGSIRNPAAWCGIVGMKATHGLVPSYGLTYGDHTLDHIGPMTTTVSDNAAMLEVMAGADWRDPQWVRADPAAGRYTAAAGHGVKGMRIGVIAEALSGCTDGTLAAFDDAQKTLARLGAEVVPVSVPWWPDAPAIWLAVTTAGMTAMAGSGGQGYGHLGRVDLGMLAAEADQQRHRGRELPPFPFSAHTMALVFEHVREVYSGIPFGRAQNLRLELRRQIDELFDEVDLLITPTSPNGPQRIPVGEPGEGYSLESRLAAVVSGFHTGLSTTCPVNLTGHPALTVPAGRGDDDMPTGLQIIGRGFDEHTVYRAGFAFEATR